MLFRPVDKIPNGYRQTKLKDELDSFLATGYKYAEYDTSEYKSVRSCFSALGSAVTRHEMKESIKVTMAEGKVYLINLLK